MLYCAGQGKKIFEIIKPYLSEKRELSALEIGSGTGSVLREFRDEGKKESKTISALGTDYNEGCIKLSNDKRVDAILGDIDVVIKLGKKFDVIIFSHVFEHFIFLGKELEKIGKLLFDDGLLYIEVPGIKTIHKKPNYNYSFLGYLTHAHIYNFTLNTLINIVSKKGFMPIFGNEEVECVFVRGESQCCSNNYDEIIFYLNFLFQNTRHLNKQLAETKKRDLMIANRDKGITALKEKSKKQNELIIIREKTIAEFKNRIDKQDLMITNRDKGIAALKEKSKKQNELIINREEAIIDLKKDLRSFEKILKSKSKLLKILFTGRR